MRLVLLQSSAEEAPPPLLYNPESGGSKRQRARSAGGGGDLASRGRLQGRTGGDHVERTCGKRKRREQSRGWKPLSTVSFGSFISRFTTWSRCWRIRRWLFSSLTYRDGQCPGPPRLAVRIPAAAKAAPQCILLRVAVGRFPTACKESPTHVSFRCCGRDWPGRSPVLQVAERRQAAAWNGCLLREGMAYVVFICNDALPRRVHANLAPALPKL